MNNIKSKRQATEPLPVFRIFVVEDQKTFREQLIKLLWEYACSYYRLDFTTSEDIESAMRILKNAALTDAPFDAVILDYNLPRTQDDNVPIKSTELGKYCVYQPDGKPPGRWFGQITSFAEDSEMQRFWPTSGGSTVFRGGLFSKEANELVRMAKDMFFGEIKVPLESGWLLQEVGAVEVPIGRRESDAPTGFNIYQFIHRLGVVWPGLDENTRTKAISLFAVDPPDPCCAEVKRIGFRSFSCWDSLKSKDASAL